MNRKPATPASSMTTAEFNAAAHEYLGQLRAQRLIQRMRTQSLTAPRNVPDLRQHTRMVVL